ncbi:MAG TPA: oxidoreductase-like domain-containing protein [Burkholderiales bacterium]|nr:oxidoreductase-like domain-containing protein [Burkholderiales bacterium]
MIPEPPEEPLPENCCERGCDRCVFTIYYEAIDAWRRDIEERWR